MAIIIAGSGKKGVGKSLLGNPNLTQRGFKLINFADILKHKVRADFGLTPEHTDGNLKEVPCAKINNMTPRQLMIDVGQLYRKYSFEGNYWLKAAFDKIDIMAPDQLVYIGDCRFKNEANYIRGKGGVIVRLERSQSLNIYTPSDDQSECDLDDYDFDAVLPAEKNKTPQDLEVFADDLIKATNETKNKCKGDYSRFNLLFSDCYSNLT